MSTQAKPISKKEIRTFNSHAFEVRINELKTKYLPLVVEYKEILKKVGCRSRGEFQTFLNSKSSFTNTRLNAMGVGLENEWDRLLELEIILDGHLTPKQVTPQNEIKAELIEEIREQFTTYFTKEQLALKNKLEKIMKLYNELPNHQRQLVFNRSGELQLNPFNTIIR